MKDGEVMIIVGLSAIGVILLQRVYGWLRVNVGLCRRCRNRRRLCPCMGGPR